MKIAIIADVYGEENNGTTVTTKRLIDNMRERGHTVKVVSTCKSSDVVLKPRNFLFLNGYLRQNGVELAKPNKKLLRSAIADCDVVHMLLPFKTGRAAIKLCKEMKKPITTAFHCQPENFSSHLFMQNVGLVNKLLYRRFRRKFFGKAQFIHCPSKFIADQLTKNKYKAEKRVISNGVIDTFKKKQVDKPAELADKICILFTGRYVGEKRHDLLIKAIKHSKYENKIQLIFAGQGPRRNKLTRLARGLTNQPIMRLFSKEDLCDTINFCDLYVHPSDVEIEAIACIEAFTCGKLPIIADSPKSATTQFALDKRNLFKPGDPVDLARRIDYWIENPEEKRALEDKYVEYAKQFSIKSCMDEMEKMFEDSVEFYQDYYQRQKAKSTARVVLSDLPQSEEDEDMEVSKPI